jgi:catechol 2,3-dioxygenase-like lactoylglutathione lyase family enzyme/predicted enzyme related to lactoylglutathione lyase
MKRVLASLAFLTCCVSTTAQMPSKRPQITGIYRVEFYSANLDTARTFYSQIVGSEHYCAWCEKLPRSAFGVSPNANQIIVLLKAPKDPPPNLLYELDFATDDLDALRVYLEANNVAILKNSNPQDRTTVVLDPEGHRIGFVQSPPGKIAPTPSQDAMRIIHAGFVVKDREAEDKFYKEILGFHVYWHGGMKEGEDNWVDMQVPEGSDWLEYMLGVSPDASHKTRGVMNHVALGVANIRDAQKLLIRHGAKPGEEPKIGRDGKWQLNLYDPDETRVELMEFTPTKDPCCSPYTGPHPHP